MILENKGFSRIKALGGKRKISRPSPALSPTVTHFLNFAKFLLLKIKLKARLPEMSYKWHLIMPGSWGPVKSPLPHIK